MCSIRDIPKTKRLHFQSFNWKHITHWMPLIFNEKAWSNGFTQKTERLPDE